MDIEKGTVGVFGNGKVWGVHKGGGVSMIKMYYIQDENVKDQI